MIFQIKAYLKFLWHSKNEHAVHSPFVFLLLTKCWYDKKSKPHYITLDNYRKILLANNESIEITDLETEPKVFKNNLQQISNIAKTAGISKKRAQLLFRIIQYFQPNNILEIGSSLGLATSAIALGNPKAKITALENCSNKMKQCKLHLQKFNINNVNYTTTKFDDYLKTEVNLSTFDFIYFNGNHSKKTTLAHFESLLSTVTNDSVWIFNAIHRSLEMEEAWEIIKQNPKVKVTIDSFQWGFVFFRKEQMKEHFILRT